MRQARLSYVPMLVLLALALAACGNGEDRPGMVTKEGGTGSATGTHTGSASGTHAGSGTAAPPFSEDQADSVVQVRLEDNACVGIPGVVKGPKVFFKATNRGAADHELEIVDANGKAVGEIKALNAGASGTLAVDLAPGTYTAQCLVELGGKPHSELGMKTTFRVE
ncbi:MAG TPA: hypothetical protein VHN78_08770 [Chloroflexota bacterium]|nr:hypothetical protein [Chloroflexota bacterium]